MDTQHIHKKTVIPNRRLREAREQRGWTHRNVADLINMPDSHTVSRWERGTSFPSAYYRRELCRVFEKSLEELGLLKPPEQEEAADVLAGRDNAEIHAAPILPPGPTVSLMPTSLSPLIGREQDITTLSALLLRSDIHLMTLLGVGGIGKTRLAIEVATRLHTHFIDGVYFVGLATIRDPALVIPSIAEALALQVRPSFPLDQAVKAALREKHLLLLLDNFEHVITMASYVEELLQACPSLKILVTSREILHVQGERLFQVSPLALPSLKALPEEPAMLTRYASIALFVQRAQMLAPSFTVTENNAHALAELCIRLDGLPLALELAAARCRLLSPRELLQRLTPDLHMLKSTLRTAEERHRTLYQTIRWSYDLLDEQEQWLLRRLALFAGGVTLLTIEQLYGDQIEGGLEVVEIVASLLDKSLLQRREQESGEPRFFMLETIRDYGLECLRTGGEWNSSWREYTTYYLELVKQAAPYLTGAQQSRWMRLLEEELDNARGALERLIEQQETAQALWFCDTFGKFCGLRGYWSEEQRWLSTVLALPYRHDERAIRARVLRRAGHLAYRLRKLDNARTLQEESIALSRAVNDRENLVGALSSLGLVLWRQGDAAYAAQLFEESVQTAYAVDNNWIIANALESQGHFLQVQGNSQAARVLLEESVARSRSGDDTESLARVLTSLTTLEISQGNLERAAALAQESSTLAHELGTRPLIALTLETLGNIAMAQGAYSQARRYFEQRKAMASELGDTPTIASLQVKIDQIDKDSEHGITANDTGK